jgi:2-oxoglutarate dehydrogenase E1 component
MSALEKSTQLYGMNSIYIEELYQNYLQNPSSVDESWQVFFRDMGDSLTNVISNKQGASWAPKTLQVVGAKNPEAAEKKKTDGKPSEEACRDSINALMLIRAYKVRGHLLSDLDPLGIEGHRPHPDLDPATYGFTDDDYDREIYIGGALGIQSATLRDLIATLRQTYSSKIGVEFMHIPDLEQRDWIASRMESVRGLPQIPVEDKKTILQDIIKVQEFEQFLHKKFPGAKRFSAEGGEAVFAAMEKIIETSANLGVKEVIIGMPHRGRLNVLTKVMGRRYASMLSEFQGNQAHFSEDIDASGDVKYHQGASSDREFEGNKIHLSLSANPSHLEAVNPVVSGRARAKQDALNDTSRLKVMGVLLHGDAAFCGQGVVPETLALSDLTGYTTSGTIHIVVNNQIGFTTSPKNGRVSPYPTDIAKGAHAPIFHVNGDDPEAVVFVSRLAVEFRQTFKKDVVVDVFCYRRYGHNEGDEPFFTQPIMYNNIKKHPTPMEVYAGRLQSEGAISGDEYQEMRKGFISYLEEEFKASQGYAPDEADWLKGRWEGMRSPERGVKDVVETGVDKNTLKKIGTALGSYPEDYPVHPKLKKQLDLKKEMMKTEAGIDWATGEALAFGSLLTEGHPVRLSGQDCTRGTFSQRHSGLINQQTEERYYPLNNLGFEGQSHYEVIDSNLSEYAVLGFEYGYSLAEPNALVLWEAQFGDFSNGAQIIIDQFISSSESKWLRFSGLVMLLPHGYEGQGPEHSSARLERYLQLCGEDNMQVANCTTPANYYHILRRQLHRDFRKPLVLMTPKSLLRHKRCVSTLDEFAEGTSFHRVIGENDPAIKMVADKDVRRVVICSGKVYYDLIDEREKSGINDVAILRLEQYYPFPAEDLEKEIARYKNTKDVVWCQEEPQNMGAWHFVDRRIEDVLRKVGGKAQRPVYAGRSDAASPAAGYPKAHKAKQQALVDQALKGEY